jgi:hypothetical protein
MRSMLVGDSKGFSVHSSLLIHIDSFLWLLGVDVSLLRLGKISSLEVEFGLVQENFIDTFRVVLSGDRES